MDVKAAGTLRPLVRIALVALLFWLPALSAAGQGFDPDGLLSDPALKKALKELNSPQKSESVFMTLANRTLQLKNVMDFCEELNEGTFTSQVQQIMDVPVEKWNMAGWGYTEIENVRQIVNQNKRNPLFHQLKTNGQHLADALALYSIAKDIYEGIQGKDEVKLKAIADTYSFVQGYIMRELGIGISNVATTGANVIAFSLNLYISELQGQYEDYWWNAYLQYMEKTYPLQSWYELAQQQGEPGVRRRLYEFWANADINAATYYQGRTRGISQPDYAERVYKDKFAAYYYSKFVYDPFLRKRFEDAAAVEAYEKEKVAARYYQQLDDLRHQIELLRRAIGDVAKLRETPITSLLITPAESTIKPGEAVSFKVLAESDGEYENVTAAALSSPTFVGDKPGRFEVTATYGGKTAAATVTVKEAEGAAVLESLTIVPAKVTLKLGDSVDFEVTALYSDGTQKDVTAASLPSPTVFGEEPGSFDVTASYEGKATVAVVDVEDSDDLCSTEDTLAMLRRLDDLESDARNKNAQLRRYAEKFQKEINDQAADACTNGIVAYSYANALDLAEALESQLDQVKDLSTEILMRMGVCPDLSGMLRAEGHSVGTLVSGLAGLGGFESQLAAMLSRLDERGCDQNDVRQAGRAIVPAGLDPDFVQDGGIMVEVAGDGVDNDADGLQDENVEALAGFNVTLVLFDSGRAKDDSFSVSVNAVGSLGTTPSGGLRSFGLNLPPGSYTVTVQVVSAPDNVGTFSLVVLENGFEIASTSGQPPQGGVAALTFTVTGN